MKHFFLLSFFLLFNLIFSQTSFICQIKNNEIQIDENIHINFILTIKTKNIKTIYEPIILPDFKEFNILNSNISENTNIINGTLSLNIIYEITLQAKKTGHFIIYPAIIKINGQIYKTQTLYLNVYKKFNKKNQQSFLTSQNNDSFVQFEIEKKNIYPYQNVLCQINLYTKNYNLINQINNVQISNLKNCIIIPIEDDNKIQQIKKFGNIYLKITLKKFLLYPLIQGKIIIPKYTIDIINSNIFFNTNSISLKTNPETIQIKKFPTPSPPNFRGAVGIFDINLITNKTILPVNSINKISIEVIGSGNFKFITPPKIIFPNSFETYNENYQNDYQITEKGLKGKIYNSQIIVPKNLGEYIIQTQPFVFFNPITKHYQTIKPKYLKIKVIKNNIFFLNQKNPLITNKHSKTINLLKKYNNFNVSNLIKLNKGLTFLFILILLISIFYIIYSKLIKNQNKKKSSNNITLVKNISIYNPNNSNNIIIQKLNSQKIKSLIKNNNKKEYYHEIEKILFQIVKNNNITMNEIEIIKKFGKEKFNTWKNLMIECQIEKFNPIPNNIDLYQFHEKIKYLLNKF